MNLFQLGSFNLHAGGVSGYKIECDALEQSDWVTLAKIVADRFQFTHAIGIPRGGLQFADALNMYKSEVAPHALLVDDVFTTGASMEEFRAKTDVPVYGVVVFARAPTPDWIHPIFQMWD